MKKKLTAIIGSMTLGLVLLAALLGLVGCDEEVQVATSQGLYTKWHVFQSATAVTSTGTAMNVGGYPAIGIQVEGITTATVTFQATIDGSTWYAIQAIDQNNGDASTTTTADGLFFVPVAADQLRCNIISYTAGTVTIVGLGSVNVAGSTLP